MDYQEADNILQINKSKFQYARKETSWDVITQGDSYVTEFRRLRPDVQQAIKVLAKHQGNKPIRVGHVPTSDFVMQDDLAMLLTVVDGKTILVDTESGAGKVYCRYATRLDGYDLNKYDSMFESKKHPLFENYDRFFNRI